MAGLAAVKWLVVPSNTALDTGFRLSLTPASMDMTDGSPSKVAPLEQN
jgi:hypothetical protein